VLLYCTYGLGCIGALEILDDDDDDDDDDVVKQLLLTLRATFD